MVQHPYDDIRKMADYYPLLKNAGTVIVISTILTLAGGEAQALEKSILLEKGVKALQKPLNKLSFSLGNENDQPEEEESRSPMLLVYNESINVKWQKKLSKGGFVGFEGNFEFDNPSDSLENNILHLQNAPNRGTFAVRAAMGLNISENSGFYLFTGASNVGLHIKENRYQREADFYLGFGFEFHLSDEVRLRAEYNLTNYGHNWIRESFAGIDSSPPPGEGFLARMLMRF